MALGGSLGSITSTSVIKQVPPRATKMLVGSAVD